LIPKRSDAETLTEQVPQYVRLGKKRGKARVECRTLPAEKRSGTFSLGHPISAYDSGQTPMGNLITKRMRPTPLLIQGEYSGEHIAIRVDDEGDNTESDGADRPVCVCLPSDVTFLRTKR
jgi:CRISPR-associated protein Csc1